MIYNEVCKAVLNRFSRGTYFSQRLALALQLDSNFQGKPDGYQSPDASAWTGEQVKSLEVFVTGKRWDLADPLQLRHVVYRPWLPGLVVLAGSRPTAPDLRSLHTLWFSWLRSRRGWGMVCRNYVGRGSVDSSFSMLPSSELSKQGLLFNSCGSDGNRGQKTAEILEERGSLTQMDFVRNGL